MCKVDRDILVYAFRYALGRRTTAPSAVAVNITRNIKVLTRHDIEQMVREIGECAATDDLGSPCDVDTWQDLKEYLLVELDRKGGVS